MHIGIWRGIHEVNGVWHAIFHGKLHGVEVVAQRAAEGKRILFDASEQSGVDRRGILNVALMEGHARIVLHDVHALLTDYVTPKVFLEVYGALQGHAEVARLVVSPKKLLGRADLVNVFPSAAVEGLEKRGKTDVI